MHNLNSHKADELRQQQMAFAACIRDPQNKPDVTGVPHDRMALYRDLFYNNIYETLCGAFPTLCSILEAERWQTLCQQFFAEYRCSTPYLSRVPLEFIHFLQRHNENTPPWLLELAQWQWTELDLFLAPDPCHIDIISDDVIHGIPILSPLVRLHRFTFPVHQLNPESILDNADGQTCFLLAWRDRDDNIGQMQINELSADLLALLQDNQQYTGLDLLEQIAATSCDIDPELIVQGGAEILQAFLNKNILLGACAPAATGEHA